MASWLDAGRLEIVAEARDADGEMVDRALEVVRQFISDRGLVLYGGLGLDYSLRMRGGSVYADGVRPDFDFLSSRSVDDAYDLADLLVARGFKHVDAIRAMHVQTMRVRVDFVVVADVSYMPAAVMDAIPRHTYQPADGGPPVTVLHPHWQYMDMHQAFCFPYRDPPREPVFHRFGKDLKRFNMLYEKYPLEEATATADGAEPSGAAGTATAPLRKIPVLRGGATAVHGAPALAMLAAGLSAMERDGDASDTTGGADTDASVNDTAPLRDLVTELEVAFEGDFALATASDPEEVLAALGYEPSARYRALMDIAPRVVVGRRLPATNGEYPEEVLLYTHSASLLAANEYGDGVWIVSPQYMLMHFLLGYHASLKGFDIALTRNHGKSTQKFADDEAASYLRQYLECKRVLNRGALLLDRSGVPAEVLDRTPYTLTSQTIGYVSAAKKDRDVLHTNMGTSQLMSLAMDVMGSKSDPCDPVARAAVPPLDEVKGLGPGAMKYRPGGARPSFDYGRFSMFRQDGGRED